jgi:hypothetical protein
LGEVRGEGGQFAIGYEGDLPDDAMMILDELHVVDESLEVLPTRELADMNEKTIEEGMRLEPGVDGFCELGEVLLSERTGGLNDGDAVLFEDIEGNHERDSGGVGETENGTHGCG